MKFTEIFKEISRYFVGGVFIFSGVIKINDPVGTSIKLKEYFSVFSADIASFFEWFAPASLFIATSLNVLEVALGTALILGYRMRIVSYILLAMIVFFTFLTFYSAYFNKVTDCGCFGDAIKLTPWQSFKKDIILLIFIIVIFLKKDTYQPFFGKVFREVKMVSVGITMIGLSLYAIAHLPFIDFRAYKVGTDISASMKPSAPLRYKYIMEKEGKKYEFEKYPTDRSYTLTAHQLLNPEDQPKITDLSVWNQDGDFTDQLFHGNKLIIVVHDVNDVSITNIDYIRNFTFSNPNFETWFLTSSSYKDFETFRHQYQLAAPYFLADATVLKTMIRSNPGILLLKNGKVLKKWHYNDIPTNDKVLTLLKR